MRCRRIVALVSRGFGNALPRVEPIDSVTPESPRAIKEIEQSTGVNRRQLYRLLTRALTAPPDGRLRGFRAPILHARVADCVRLSPVKLNGERGSRGAVGALSQLLERFPVLAAWLQLQIKQHRVNLDQLAVGCPHTQP